MMEYFIRSYSFAAPFVSDEAFGYQPGETPEDAIDKFRASYSHHAGLYSAEIYSNADAYHKKEQPLLQWLSDKAKKTWGM